MPKKNRRFYDADEIDNIINTFVDGLTPIAKMFWTSAGLIPILEEIQKQSEIIEEDIRENERSKINIKVKRKYLNSKDAEWYNCKFRNHYGLFTYNRIDTRSIDKKYYVCEIMRNPNHDAKNHIYKVCENVPNEQFYGTLIYTDKLPYNLSFTDNTFKIIRDTVYKGIP